MIPRRAIVAGLIAVCGCGTVTQVIEERRLRTYGGVDRNIDDQLAVYTGRRKLFLPALWIDLPLSMAVDTALLPVALPWDMITGSRPQPDPDSDNHYVRGLVRLLDYPEHETRLQAAALLGDAGAEAIDAGPTLEVVSLEDPDADVRRAAALALRRIRTGGRE